MTNLKDLVDIVRQSRERTADVFPLPSIDDCIDFAITEAAEYIDARKRENPIYKRNRDKEHSPRKEWGQTGYMIASAVIQVDTTFLSENDWLAFPDVLPATVHDVIRMMCNVQCRYETGLSPHLDVFDAWHLFATHQGYDPAELLRETCTDVETKHLSFANRKPVYPVLTAEEAAAQGEVA